MKEIEILNSYIDRMVEAENKVNNIKNAYETYLEKSNNLYIDKQELIKSFIWTIGYYLGVNG